MIAAAALRAEGRRDVKELHACEQSAISAIETIVLIESELSRMIFVVGTGESATCLI